MASLSEKLRRERELRGISLKQISEDTKIGVRFLEALEEDRLELIPGEFYRRSYLRAYARYLGLDEDRAVNAYKFANQEKEPETSGDENRQVFALAPWAVWILAAGVFALVVVLFVRSSSDPAPSVPSNARPDTSPQAPAGNVASVANASVASPRGESLDGNADALPSTSGPAATFNPSADVASDVPMLTPPLARARSREDGALRLVVTVGESCWLEIEADGQVVTTGLKEQGFRGEFSADNEVRLWLGNAGGVSLWVNDRPLRSLGRAGQVRKDLAITPENYLDFVSSGPGPSS